ncbi:MAG: DUF2752 domain-containing protein [bacterium]|jgi:hypothetical protein|nr:DUF2752 domain-containing protein [bacterium]
MIPFESHQLSSAQKLNRYIFIAGILLILLFTLFWNPERANLLPCYFHEITGHSCPSCGLTRSFHAIAQLNFQQSFEFHPMGMIVYFALMVFVLKFILEIVLKKEIRLSLKDWVKKFAIGGLLFVWMGLWIIRLLHE